MLLTQHFDLALDERDRGPAACVWQPQARQHCLVALEEVGIALQIDRDGLFLGFYGGHAARISCCHSFQTST